MPSSLRDLRALRVLIGNPIEFPAGKEELDANVGARANGPLREIFHQQNLSPSRFPYPAPQRALAVA
jgi:hypothetical protein